MLPAVRYQIVISTGPGEILVGPYTYGPKRPSDQALRTGLAGEALVLDRHAVHVAAAQLLAGGLGLVALEPGEARPIEGLVALGDRLGERLGVAEQLLRLALRLLEVLLRFALGG